MNFNGNNSKLGDELELVPLSLSSELNFGEDFDVGKLNKLDSPKTNLENELVDGSLEIEDSSIIKIEIEIDDSFSFVVVEKAHVDLESIDFSMDVGQPTVDASASTSSTTDLQSVSPPADLQSVSPPTTGFFLIHYFYLNLKLRVGCHLSVLV